MNQHSFLFQAIIFLASAVIFVPLAKRLNLGSVLGYLLAGIVIGPFVFGFVGKEGEDIRHYAEFGVVMMLFVIGLELEPERLWKLRRSILGLGGLQLVITTLIIAGFAILFGTEWEPALVLGIILSMSSTAVVLQFLSEKGMLNTTAGQSSFVVLLFQDIAVIPIIALLPLFGADELQNIVTGSSLTWVEGKPGWLKAIIVSGVIAGVIITGRLLIRPLLRIVAKTRLREIFTASSLLIVIGIAVLMTQVGLSPALGAFLAGVVLANSEYRHELESDIEPFKGLLLGIFFTAIGASINFHLVFDQPWVVIGWVFLLIVVKTSVLLLIGKIFKISAEQNFIFSFSLSQVGEFAFVLLSFSLQQGILQQSTVDMMIAVTAISMALTPLVMLMNEKIILPRIIKEKTPEKQADTIDEKNPVIIAGFGHFGSTVGRFLKATKINATYLDIDSDRVDLLRRMGLHVFYGDASRAELLQSAGAATAKIIIIAIGSEEKRLEMVETIKKHFPHLHMLVRSTNRYDAYKQMNAGILHIYRETLDASLRVGVDAMSLLGYRRYTARRLANTFFKYDEITLKKLSAIQDQEEYISEVRKFIEESELTMQRDNQYNITGTGGGWDAESLRQEASH
jgi:CPA2 family monovalent cation:H+ antiporter-2